MDWSMLLEPSRLALLIPIVAIICGIGIGITKMIIDHRERMAMIERGIDPDARRPPQQP